MVSRNAFGSDWVKKVLRMFGLFWEAAAMVPTKVIPKVHAKEDLIR